MDELFERLGVEPNQKTKDVLERALALWNRIGQGQLAEQVICLALALTDESAGRVSEVVDAWDFVAEGTPIRRKRPHGHAERGTFVRRREAPYRNYVVVRLVDDPESEAAWHTDECQILKAVKAAPIEESAEPESSSESKMIPEEEELGDLLIPEEEDEVEIEDETERVVDFNDPWGVSIDKAENGDEVVFTAADGSEATGFFRRFDGNDVMVGMRKTGTPNIRVSRQAVILKNSKSSEMIGAE